MPEPTFDAAGHGRYEGVVEFRRKARVIPSAYHQACDAFSRRVPKL